MNFPVYGNGLPPIRLRYGFERVAPVGEFALVSVSLMANGSKFEVVFHEFPEVLPKKSPAPARMDVLPSPNGSQAKPNRGEKWVFLSVTMPLGTVPPE